MSDAPHSAPSPGLGAATLGERDWIARLRTMLPASNVGASQVVKIGVGDDAALIAASPDGVLVTTDMLMDGVDFRVGETPLELIGRKCLAVNLSDIAAMAGRPTSAFLSLALPRAGGREIAARLYEGIVPLAEEFGVVIAGGDTNSWEGPLVVCVTVLGEPTFGRAVTRSGAGPGDVVFVTGSLGGSLASLRHCRFTPRVREAQAIHGRVGIRAMIDLSDGLATDLGHIASESRVGIEIDSHAVPIHADVPGDLPDDERLRRALTDGEDFELALMLSREDAAALAADPLPDVSLIPVGRCIDAPGLWLGLGAHRRPLMERGWEHEFQ